jgi:hypothetical protein
MLSGKCYVKDDLTPILDAIKKRGGFIVGFRIEMRRPSALSHAFLECIIFSNSVYRRERTVYPKPIKTGLIVNACPPVQAVQKMMSPILQLATGQPSGIFSSCEWIGAHNTAQVDDAQHRRKQFPLDLTAPSSSESLDNKRKSLRPSQKNVIAHFCVEKHPTVPRSAAATRPTPTPSPDPRGRPTRARHHSHRAGQTRYAQSPQKPQDPPAAPP